jgi:hypothetical protein
MLTAWESGSPGQRQMQWALGGVQDGWPRGPMMDLQGEYDRAAIPACDGSKGIPILRSVFFELAAEFLPLYFAV